MVKQRGKTQPIIIDSAEPLQLPPICACCGGPGTHAIVIKPTEPPSALHFSQNMIVEVAGGIVHPLGLALAVKTLASPNVSIPLCARCRFNHFMLGKDTFVYVILLIAFFIVTFVEGFRQNYNWMLLALLAAFISLVLVVRKNARHDLDTLPVRVYIIGKKFRYVIYGGSLYSQLGRIPNLPTQT